MRRLLLALLGLATCGAPPAPAGSSCSSIDKPVDMVLEIPSIDLECPVFAGDAAELDAGALVLLSSPEWVPTLATVPGEAGTVWIGGHHTTHGAPFDRLLDVQLGDVVNLTGNGFGAAYVIVGRYHAQTAPMATDGNARTRAIYREDHDGVTPRLTLQTSDGAGARWFVYADLVGRS